MVYRTLIFTAILLLCGSLIYPGPHSGKKNHLVPKIESNDPNIYLELNDTSINYEAFQMAMIGYKYLVSKELVIKKDLLTIIDYSKPSDMSRFYVINLKDKRVLFKTLVAHGRNSGEIYANRFSNKVHSYQSALGFFITGNSYLGGQGYSLLMHGVDTGYNENARKRSIVIHGADYVSDNYIQLYGRLGRSYGCPALPKTANTPIIDLIKEGSIAFSYYPDKDYARFSKIISSSSNTDIQVTASKFR